MANGHLNNSQSINSESTRSYKFGERKKINLIATLTAILLGGYSFDSKSESATMNSINDSNITHITFSRHSFGAYCFDVMQCEVTYANRLAVNRKAPAPSPRPDFEKRIYADHIDIPNFPGPVHAIWKSKDGSALEATIDISSIASNQLIRTQVNPDDIKTSAYIGDPGIILVIRDRTATLYMKAFVTLKAPLYPDKPLSNFADDAVVIWTKDY